MSKKKNKNSKAKKITPTIDEPEPTTPESSSPTTEKFDEDSYYSPNLSDWSIRHFYMNQPSEYQVTFFGESMIFSRVYPATTTQLCALLQINEKNTLQSLTEEYITNLENYVYDESKKSYFQVYNTTEEGTFFDESYKQTLMETFVLEPKDVIQSPLYHVEENVEILKILTSSPTVSSLSVLPFVKRLAMICLQSANLTKFITSQGIAILVRLLQLFSKDYTSNEFSKEVITQICFLSSQICKVNHDTRITVRRMGLFYELWKLATEAEDGVLRYNAKEAISKFLNDFSIIGHALKGFVNNSLYSDMKIMVPLNNETHSMDTIFAHRFIFEARCSAKIFEEIFIPSQDQVYLLKKNISRKALLYFVQFLYSDSMEYFEEDETSTITNTSWETEVKQGNILELANYLHKESKEKFNYLLGTNRDQFIEPEVYIETRYHLLILYTVAIPKAKYDKVRKQQMATEPVNYSLILEKDLYSYFEFTTFKSSNLEDLLPCENGARIFKVPKEINKTTDENDFVYFKAHSFILVSRSEYFKNLLTSGFCESESQIIEIENCCAAAFEIVLQSLYCGEDEFQFCYQNYGKSQNTVKTRKCEIDQTNAVEILIVSHMFMLSSLKCKAEQEILKGITKQNAPVLLQIAEAYNVPTIETACKQLLS